MPMPGSARVFASLAVVLIGCVAPARLLADSYAQINLVSDIPGNAILTDPNLVDPWGVSFSGTSPFWISDNGTDKSTLYTGAPAINALVVNVAGSPTGQVNNGSTTAFKLSDGAVANFIFDTQSGTVLAWNGGLGTTAAVVATTAGASYTGLAINSSSSLLYAANMAGTIDVFDSSFAPTTLAGKFIDPSLPAGYVPYNIQAIGSQLYVTYVIYDSTGSETDSGIVDIFNTDGTFVKRFSSNSHLDAPWGIVQAPSTFGIFGGDILIGNFLNGEINAFDPNTGVFLGTISGGNGVALSDPGLWALEFRTGGTGNATNALYFTAGIYDETHGLFGEIVPTPEPAPLLLAGMGIVALVVGRRMRAGTPAAQDC